MARFRLKEIAEPQRWTIRKLSEATGLARNTVAGVWNNSTQYVNLNTLEALAKVLHVSVSDLIANGDAQETEEPRGNEQPMPLAA
jgi:DNA-binding Xre family transcriptional regulator